MKLYLIRHGETTSDLEDRYGGDYDDHLTEEGRRQAESLAEKLSDSGIEVIFCSPKIRTWETAEILAGRIGCAIEVVHDIRERNMYGILTGMIKAEAKEKHSEHVEALKNHRHTIPESENYEDFGERIRKSLKILASSSYQTIAILSHGGPISFIFREILKLGDVKIDDCGFVEFEAENDTFSVIKMDGIQLKSQPI